MYAQTKFLGASFGFLHVIFLKTL